MELVKNCFHGIGASAVNCVHESNPLQIVYSDIGNIFYISVHVQLKTKLGKIAVVKNKWWFWEC